MAVRGAAAMKVERHCAVQGEQGLLRPEQPCWMERQRVPAQPNEVLAQVQVQQQLAEALRQAGIQPAQLVPPSLAQPALVQALFEQVLALEQEQQQAQPPASGPAG